MSDTIYAAQQHEIAALCRENAKLKRRLEILKDHGIEIVDAVAGGFEIYNKEHVLADKLKGENENLAKQIEALKDYARALELCLGESQLCEYCTFNGIDFEHDDIHCTVDFDGLRKKAGMEQ